LTPIKPAGGIRPAGAAEMRSEISGGTRAHAGSKAPFCPGKRAKTRPKNTLTQGKYAKADFP